LRAFVQNILDILCFVSSSERQIAMPKSAKEYHLLDLLTGESLGGFASLTAAREEARAAGLTRWDIFQGNLRIERHDPNAEDPVLDHPDLRRGSYISVTGDARQTLAGLVPTGCKFRTLLGRRVDLPKNPRSQRRKSL